MIVDERRVTPRLRLHTLFTFHRTEALANGEYQVKAINLSTRGVYFASNLMMHVGEVIEILLEMPKRISGTSAPVCRFTGRIIHVERGTGMRGQWGIGVELIYYERRMATPGI